MNNIKSMHSVRHHPRYSQKLRHLSSSRGGNVPARANNTKQTPFIPGTKLVGPGIKAMDKHRKPLKIRNGVGAGTIEDPFVGWTFLPSDRDIDHAMQEEHVNLCRQVARKNGFACILIRTEVHMQQCIYDENGMRSTMMLASGVEKSITVAADPHLTVYMGSGPYNLHVQGHIFVTFVKDPPKVKLMDYPSTQRLHVANGHSRVAEEFWWTRGTKLKVYQHEC